MNFLLPRSSIIDASLSSADLRRLYSQRSW